MWGTDCVRPCKPMLRTDFYSGENEEPVKNSGKTYNVICFCLHVTQVDEDCRQARVEAGRNTPDKE